MWLNYQQLRYFRDIAHKGSIAKASESLLISSPALSKQLRQLEDMLGDQLFIREKRKLVLTHFGAYVLDYADKIFSAGEELISNINNRLYQNIFKVGVNAGLPKTITTGLIDHITTKYKDTSIQVFEADDQQLLQNLLSHQCDIIFTDRKLYSQENEIHSEKFYESPLSFYATKKYQKLSENFPISLEAAPLLLPSVHSHLRNTIDEWFQAKHLHYTLVAELQDSGSKKLLACEDKGLVVISEVGARQYYKSKQLIKVGDLDAVEEFYYTTRLNHQSDLVKKVTKELSSLW